VSRFASALAPVLAVASLLGACGRPEGGRVLVLAIDGLDPATIDLLLSEGELPHFAQLRLNGAYAPLRSQKPLLSPIVWTTVATGRNPEVHGISHFVAEDPATGETLPVTRQMRSVKAVWNILSDAGRQVAVVGWWGTWPPEPVNGAIVSDHTAYHFLFDAGLREDLKGDEIYPEALAEEISPLLRRPTDIGPNELARFVNVDPAELADTFSFEDELSHLRWGLAAAESYRDIGLYLWRQRHPDVALVYFEVTDSAAHLFGHLFRNEDLAGELAAQRQRYGATVEEVYRLADEILGEYLAVIDSDTTLIVLSDHGFRLGALHDDPSRTRDLRRVSERFHREEGVLYLYGARIRPGARLETPTILDVTPTILALAGVAPAADMPGRVLLEGLLLEEDPPRVATHETGAGETLSLARAGETEDATLRRLRALGYLGSAEEDVVEGEVARPSAAGLRNLAAIHFEAGQLEEALALYRQLVASSPEDAALRTSLAGTLGALGRYEEAMAQIEEALATDSLNVEAYHNRGVIQERAGDRTRAIESYRAAVRYAPAYEPSLRALARLGVGGAPVQRTPPQEEAVEWAERAAAAARRGDYATALTHLDAAEKLAPELAVIQQYRSNVAYLMGDLEGAVAALERGLELEPDNELFRVNLERLRSRG
jgi:tetratricopeptide (TPR) repeat protein